MYRSIPTPSTSAFQLGPFTVHFYALCIIVGVVLAVWIGDRRFIRFGGAPGVVSDVAFVAVPAGIIGGRLYHLATSPDAYFGAGGAPLDAFKIWEGGLGIWGAISLGTVAAYWKFKRVSRADSEPRVSFAVFADALAPGVLVAQAIGRIGNWFNGELFGKPTDLPWALDIPLRLRPRGYEGFETFHPTFLYESLWCLFLALLIVKFGKRFRPGQSFLFYVSAYSIGRMFIELLRIDEAHRFFGLRLNVFVSAAVASIAAGLSWKVTRAMKVSGRFPAKQTGRVE
ncbi:MAG: prolipoprotein diacylglyceryl transferase [Actinobacteria bacterium]|nr:prolipoprotein diacylglyceryl transferase [Actinomycetota bacterium]